MSWRIKEWDPVRAQGTIASGLGELPFDAAVAMVADFEIGEAVEVLLEPEGSTYRVRRVAPTSWRRPASPSGAGALDPAVLSEVAGLLADRHQLLRILEDGEVRLEIAPRPYEASVVLSFTGASFVQMPLEPSFARLVAFDFAAFAAVSSLPEAWGVPPAPLALVFRFEPERFGEAAGYVVAQHLQLHRSG